MKRADRMSSSTTPGRFVPDQRRGDAPMFVVTLYAWVVTPCVGGYPTEEQTPTHVFVSGR